MSIESCSSKSTNSDSQPRDHLSTPSPTVTTSEAQKAISNSSNPSQPRNLLERATAMFQSKRTTLNDKRTALAVMVSELQNRLKQGPILGDEPDIEAAKKVIRQLLQNFLRVPPQPSDVDFQLIDLLNFLEPN